MSGASKTAVEDIGLIDCSLLAACLWNCAADLVCGHRGLEKQPEEKTE